MIEHNDVRANNRLNEATHGFQSLLPPGVGILLVGVSGHTIAKNTVEGNDFVGIGILGWCTATAAYDDYNCVAKPPVIDDLFYDPAAKDNLISQNKVSDNGTSPPEDAPFPPADLLYVKFALFGDEGGAGNCFEKNKPRGFTYFSATELDFSNGYPEPVPEPLPTDGCSKP